MFEILLWFKRLLTLFCNNILQNIQNICALYLWTQWNVALPAHAFLVSYFCAMTLKLKCYVKGYVKSRSRHLKQVVFCLKVAQSVWFLSSEAEWALQKDAFNCVPLLCLQSENAGKFQTKSWSVYIVVDLFRFFLVCTWLVFLPCAERVFPNGEGIHCEQTTAQWGICFCR